MQKHQASVHTKSERLIIRSNSQSPDSAQWIKAATERIVECFQPEQVILFGSQARGDATAHSDIDLLVVFQEVTNTHERAVAIRRALSNLPIAKDIVITTKQEIAKYGYMVGRDLRPALREGKVLYERK